MKRTVAAMALAGSISAMALSGCSSILYLPSDAVYEDVVVETSEDLLAQVVVSADYCDDLVVQGTLENNSTSDATVDVTIGLDDGVAPAELLATIEVPAGSSTPFELENTTGINPFMGCSATVTAAEIVASS